VLFGIRWPKTPQVLSAKDGQYADARPEDFAELRIVEKRHVETE